MDVILESALILAGQCDGARTVDGAGFNKFDSPTIKRMLAREGQWSARERMFVGTTLLKYGRQLGSERVDSIKEELKLLAMRLSQSPRPETAVHVEGSRALFYSPYDPSMVQTFREAGGRWDAERRCWSVDLRSRTVQRALEQFQTKYPQATTDPIPDLPFGSLRYIDDITVGFDTAYDSRFVDAAKQMRGQWNSEVKMWVFIVDSRRRIKELNDLCDLWNVEVTEEAQGVFSTAERAFDLNKQASEAATSNIQVPLPEGLELYPFQRAGIEWIDKRNGRALIADEMGLGKTVQALGYLNLHPEIKRALIVCPAFLKKNWERECKRWLVGDRSISIINGKGNNWEADVLIVNYDILKKHIDRLIAVKADIMVVDECHYVKNSKAQRTKAIMEIARPITRVVALSGTPLLNRPIEMFTTLKLINREQFKDYWGFAQRYCNAYRSSYGWVLDGVSHSDELNDLLRSTVMIRRKKVEVLKELPPKRRLRVMVSPPDMDEYHHASSDFVGWLREEYVKRGIVDVAAKVDRTLAAEALTHLNALRVLIGKAKVGPAVEWLDEWLQSSEGKIVVFTVHKQMVETIMSVLRGREYDVAGFTGDTSLTDRQVEVDRFLDDEQDVRVFVCTYGAGGVGLNLQKAADVLLVEYPWRPADLHQAEDRIHRIGQDESVTVWEMTTERTIEDDMLDLLSEKMAIADRVLDGGMDATTEGIAKKLMERMLAEAQKKQIQDAEEHY